MSKAHPIHKPIVAAIAAIVMYSIPLHVSAQEPEDGAPPQLPLPELPDTVEEEESTGDAAMDETALLRALEGADAAEAQRLDRQLQALWSKSGSAAMDLLLRRGRDALEEGNTRAAIEHLTALTDHAPGFAEGWHMRASAYYEAQLYGPALADLERALSLNPNNYNAIFGLGAILETFGDAERAYEAYSRAKAIHPHHEQITKALERLAPEIEGSAL